MKRVHFTGRLNGNAQPVGYATMRARYTVLGLSSFPGLVRVSSHLTLSPGRPSRRDVRMRSVKSLHAFMQLVAVQPAELTHRSRHWASGHGPPALAHGRGGRPGVGRRRERHRSTAAARRLNILAYLPAENQREPLSHRFLLSISPLSSGLSRHALFRNIAREKLNSFVPSHRKALDLLLFRGLVTVSSHDIRLLPTFSGAVCLSLFSMPIYGAAATGRREMRPRGSSAFRTPGDPRPSSCQWRRR